MKPPGQPALSHEGQNIATDPAEPRWEDGQENSGENRGPGDEDAESVDSNITQEIGTEGLLRHAADYRDRKITIGGLPTRSIAGYSKEKEQKRLLLSDPRMDPDKEYYRNYCRMERDHFYQELMAWESFLRWIRRDWAERNKAAGGSIPPPPPVHEMDPLALHLQYLGFLLLIRKEGEDLDADAHIRQWHFHSYFHLLEHIAAVESQVVDLRKKKGLKDDARFEEQLRIVQEQLGGYQARQGQQDSGPPPSIFFKGRNSAGSPEPVETEAKGSTRKRKSCEESPELEQKHVVPEVGLQDHTAPAPKRRKRSGPESGLASNAATALAHKLPRGKEISSKRGKAKADTQDDETEDERPEPAHDTENTRGKRKGRPFKQSQSAPTLDTTRRGEVKTSQKRRGRPSGKVQRPPAQSAKGEVKKRTKQHTNKTAPAATGVRRSGRIAAQQKGTRK